MPAMSMVSMEGEHDDRVHAVLLTAGNTGLSLRELEQITDLTYRVLHNVTWRLENQGRARRVPGTRPIRYVARASPPRAPFVPLRSAPRQQGTEPRHHSRGDQTRTRPTWRPRRDGDARRASAIQLAESVLAAEGLTEGHRREALSLAIWFYTEADGKWNTRYRSAGAVGAAPKMLNHEHVLTRRALVERLLSDPENCAQTMRTAVACCVLREEHKRLTALDGARSSLTGWRRYAAAGIEVIDLATGQTLDLEGANEL
jgi:hypothetical protein